MIISTGAFSSPSIGSLLKSHEDVSSASGSGISSKPSSITVPPVGVFGANIPNPDVYIEASNNKKSIPLIAFHNVVFFNVIVFFGCSSIKSPR